MSQLHCEGNHNIDISWCLWATIRKYAIVERKAERIHKPRSLLNEIEGDPRRNQLAEGQEIELVFVRKTAPRTNAPRDPHCAFLTDSLISPSSRTPLPFFASRSLSLFLFDPFAFSVLASYKPTLLTPLTPRSRFPSAVAVIKHRRPRQARWSDVPSHFRPWSKRRGRDRGYKRNRYDAARVSGCDVVVRVSHVSASQRRANLERGSDGDKESESGQARAIGRRGARLRERARAFTTAVVPLSADRHSGMK